MLRDHLSPPPTVQRAIGLEKETTVELTNIGFGTTIAGDPGRWHIDTDRKPDDNKPIIEIVIEHFDEHAGAEEDAHAELTRRIDDAWAWVDGVRGLDPNESLRDGGIPNLTGEVGELTRRGAKTALNGVVHITVGVGMSSVPRSTSGSGRRTQVVAPARTPSNASPTRRTPAPRSPACCRTCPATWRPRPPAT